MAFIFVILYTEEVCFCTILHAQEKNNHSAIATPKINFYHLKTPRYNYFFAAWHVFLCGFSCTYISVCCLFIVVCIWVLLKK